jgi:pinoresinol/lariciresinol reductase
MEEQKSRVLVVGGTGFMGRRLVRASLAEGHPTFVLMRPEIGVDVDKLQMLLSFKAQGARLVEASLEDHAALVAAVSQVDVVVSAMSGAHIRSHNLQLQNKIVEAIKEAGNVKVRHTRYSFSSVSTLSVFACSQFFSVNFCWNKP